MSEQFEQIKEGMLQAISHAMSRPVPGTRVHYPKPVDVKALLVGVNVEREFPCGAGPRKKPNPPP